MINWDNTGNEKVIALIEVKVTPQRGLGFDKIAERIYQYSEVNSVYPVSYTHLDVYKRQGRGRYGQGRGLYQ